MRNISLSYSRIYLKDVAAKLALDHPEDMESIAVRLRRSTRSLASLAALSLSHAHCPPYRGRAMGPTFPPRPSPVPPNPPHSSLPTPAPSQAKAIRDGVIEATLDHKEGVLYSKEPSDVYSTLEPQVSK